MRYGIGLNPFRPTSSAQTNLCEVLLRSEERAMLIGMGEYGWRAFRIGEIHVHLGHTVGIRYAFRIVLCPAFKR